MLLTKPLYLQRLRIVRVVGMRFGVSTDPAWFWLQLARLLGPMHSDAGGITLGIFAEIFLQISALLGPAVITLPAAAPVMVPLASLVNR